MSVKSEAQNRMKELVGSRRSQKTTGKSMQAVRSNPSQALLQRAGLNPGSLTAGDFMQIKHTAGNRAIQRMFAGEAGMLSTTIQREPIKEEDEEKLQRKLADGANALPVQRVGEEEDENAQLKAAPNIQQSVNDNASGQTENHTGMQDNLKAGLENLSGLDLSGVRVHHNSDKPAQVGALAYTQGSNIYVAPGQERHLPHEGWHAIQQMQGRVQKIGEVAGLPLNDDSVLEREADVMGGKATQLK